MKQSLPTLPGSMILIFATANETFKTPVFAVLSNLDDAWTVISEHGYVTSVLGRNISAGVWTHAQVSAV